MGYRFDAMGTKRLYTPSANSFRKLFITRGARPRAYSSPFPS